MANIFDVTNEANNDINLNVFDWSHQSSATFKFGYIYPVLSFLAPQNSSFRIHMNAGMQFMPFAFPVQTDIRVRFSFYRVALRTLWEDYKDYVGNFRPNLEEPYLDLATSFNDFMGTGKLADFLDIPTTISGKFGVENYERSLNPNLLRPVMFSKSDDLVGDVALQTGSYMEPRPGSLNDFSEIVDAINAGRVTGTLPQFWFALPVEGILGTGNVKRIEFPYNFQVTYNETTLGSQILAFFPPNGTYNLYMVGLYGNEVVSLNTLTSNFEYNIAITGNMWRLSFDMSSLNMEPATLYAAKADSYFLVFGMNCNYSKPSEVVALMNSYDASSAQTGGSSSNVSFIVDDSEEVVTTTVDINRSNSPYYDSTSSAKDHQIKLAAYRARAYESIYNAYCRDKRNNPYYLNGEVQYNVWIPTNKGGADKTTYQLHRANWEKDFLTTAVPSPQQGRAPLVGLTTYATTDDTGVTRLNMAIADENGKRYAVNYEADEEGLNSVSYAALDDKTEMEPLSFRQLVDAASTGISIPDLRIVNAYQKFLELNMRKDYSYKQIIEGRFDCKVRYDDLNMPEFLGGFTRSVTMNRVVQSVERGEAGSVSTGKYSDALGSLAGDAFLNTGDTPTIPCFCDEESIVMCIMSIVPVANYSQLLPKDYLYRDLLDHFQPEFNHLGFQPITYREVCPVQAFNAGMDLNTVFGYNRPWYELVQRYDMVHGDMRTTLRNFLINRVFDVAPQLSESFLLVDPEQVNDVFAVTQDTDKIIAQMYFDIKAKLPVSRVAIPRLD